MVDSNVGWDVEVAVTDSIVKRWLVNGMFDELAGGVEVGEAQERGTAGVSEDK